MDLFLAGILPGYINLGAQRIPGNVAKFLEALDMPSTIRRCVSDSPINGFVDLKIGRDAVTRLEAGK